MKWAVTEKFKEYLWGAEFTVFTDNNPLVHLEMARLGAVEQRWAAQLANFRYTIKYRPGTENRNADALSRLPEQKGEVAPVHADRARLEKRGHGKSVKPGTQTSPYYVNGSNNNWPGLMYVIPLLLI